MTLMFALAQQMSLRHQVVLRHHTGGPQRKVEPQTQANVDRSKLFTFSLLPSCHVYTAQLGVSAYRKVDDVVDAGESFQIPRSQSIGEVSAAYSRQHASPRTPHFSGRSHASLLLSPLLS